MDKYLGIINNAKLTRVNVVETLDPEKAFVQKKYILTFSDETSVPLQTADYYEFQNTVTGKKELAESDLDEKIKNAILTFWGE